MIVYHWQVNRLRFLVYSCKEKLTSSHIIASLFLNSSDSGLFKAGSYVHVFIFIVPCTETAESYADRHIIIISYVFTIVTDKV